MFCKKCGNEQKNGENFCSKCGTPFLEESVSIKETDSNGKKEEKIEASKVQYCKKCGRQQVNGQKFCLQCGTPYLDKNGKPYLKGLKKDIVETKERMNAAVDDLSQKGREFGEQLVQKGKGVRETMSQKGKELGEQFAQKSKELGVTMSQKGKEINEKISEASHQGIKRLEKDKNFTQEEQANNTIEVTEESKNKTVSLAKIAGIIGCILILAPFFITGFGFNWFWYLVIVGVVVFTLAMFGVEGKEISDYSMVKTTFIGFLVVGCIMYLWGPLNPDFSDEQDENEVVTKYSSDSYDSNNKTFTPTEYVTCSNCGEQFVGDKHSSFKLCPQCNRRQVINQASKAFGGAGF